MKISPFILAGTLALTLGCKKNPIERLSNPVPSGAVPVAGTEFIIFDDELKTGGGLGFIPGGENQAISLDDTSSPRSGSRQIRYEWNGADVFNSTTSAFQHEFAGFSLLVAENFPANENVAPKDISGPGYTKLKMKVRGSLSTNTRLRIEGPSDGDNDPLTNTPEQVELTSLTNDWQEVVVPSAGNIPNTHFQAVKSFITISLQYSIPPRTTVHGGGGVVYLDDIRYVVE